MVWLKKVSFNGNLVDEMCPVIRNCHTSHDQFQWQMASCHVCRFVFTSKGKRISIHMTFIYLGAYSFWWKYVLFCNVCTKIFALYLIVSLWFCCLFSFFLSVVVQAMRLQPFAFHTTCPNVFRFLLHITYFFTFRKQHF